MRFQILAAGTLFSALALPAASADILLLRDGRIIDGPKMERVDDDVVIHFENGDIRVPDAMVESCLITGGPEFEPRTDEEKEKYAKGLVPFEGDWVKPAKRDKEVAKIIAAKREVIEDAIAHSEWGNRHKDETKNFRWEYTIPEFIAEGLKDRLESYYDAFKKDWRISRDKRKKKLMINFFGDRKEFNRTSGAGGGALAYFMFLGDYDLCCFYDRLDPVSTEMVLYHEASHYMQKLINEDFKMPHWPGEGMAEYYGGALWNGKSLDVGLIQEGRLTEVKNNIALGTRLSPKEIVTVDAYTDYTWGWALVHFFMNDKRYNKGFRKYFVGLANDKGVDRTVGSFNLKFVSGDESWRYLKECLKIVDEEDEKELEADFYDYVENTLQLTSTTGLEKAAISAKNIGKPLKAKRLFQEAMDAGSESALAHHHYASLIKYEDKKKAEALWRKACELDPVTGAYWYELGRLVERNDETEGKRLKALARELDPEVDVWDLDFDPDDLSSDD